MEKKFNGTQGKWLIEDEENNGIFIKTETGNSAICRVYTNNNIINGIEGNLNAKLIAAAPNLLEALQLAKSTICRLKLSMLAHPDCTDGSEFDDYTSTAQEVEDQIEEAINKALD